MSQLSVSGITIEYGGAPLLKDVTFNVERGDRWGIVGRNGTGKTSLFRILNGQLAPTRGSVAREPGLTVSLLDQHRDFAGAGTVWEAAAGPLADLVALERSLADQAAAFAEVGDAVTQAMLDRYSHDLERFEREGGYTLTPRIDAVLHGLGFDPEDARTRALAGLSGGERGRLGLARQLIAPGDIVMLDEPTNHLDLETTDWLEGYLKSLDRTVLLISHDRAFLQSVVDHVLHVEHGTATPYDAGYDDFVRLRSERRLSQQRAFDRQRKAIEAEEDFIRRNIAGGNSAQAKGRRRRLARVERLSAPAGDAGVMSVRFESGERGGDQVIVADDVTIAIGERILIERFSARVQRGDVIGLIGPNGAGKSTLLKTFMGERMPMDGAVRIPDSIRAAYYRQDLAQVPADQSLYDIIADRRPMWGRGPVQGHLGRFGFTGDSVLRSAGTLSGGERARMALALMMLEGANLLIFDEPTNHLDVESIEELEDAIDGFEGTVLLVSHDRALLRALVTRVWVLHGRHVTDFPGSFEEWELTSAERAHAATVAAQEEQQGALRRARRALETAEAEVAEGEARLAELTGALDDPELYTTPDGQARAQRMGAELEKARATLDGAIERWAAATEEVERLGAEADAV